MSRTTLSRFLKFGLIGVVGLGVDYAALLFARDVLGLGLYAGAVFSYLVAASATWAGNRFFTFKEASRTAPLKQWAAFLSANALGFLVNRGVYAALITFMPFVHANPFFALAAGSLAGMIFNFAASSRFIFRVP